MGLRPGRRKRKQKTDKERERFRVIEIEKTLGRIEGSGEVWKYKE